jgi:hypothetical protein
MLRFVKDTLRRLALYEVVSSGSRENQTEIGLYFSPVVSRW